MGEYRQIVLLFQSSSSSVYQLSKWMERMSYLSSFSRVALPTMVPRKVNNAKVGEASEKTVQCVTVKIDTSL